MTEHAPSAPLPSLCRAEQALLLVVDVQERLGAAMPAKVLGRMVQNTRLLLRSADLLGVPTILTEQYPKGLGSTVAEVAQMVPPTATRLEKTCFSCLGAGGFPEALRAEPRRQVVLAGMEAHVCVLQTAAELAEAGLEVFVVEDAICSRRLENYQNALERLRALGIVVTNAESVVFEWLRDARHPHFRAVQGLLR